MKHNSFSSMNDTIWQPRRAVTGLMLLLVLAFAYPAQAQTTPALQFAPVVTTFAGGATTSTLCANATDTLGDGCPATQAILSSPTTGDTDAAGNLYFPDSANNVVRRIDATTGIITLVAGEVGSTAQCAGANDTIGDNCPALQAPLNDPRCVRIDRAGNIVIADVSNQVLRSINKSTGIITLLMGEIGKAAHVAPKNTTPLTPLTTEFDNPYIFIYDPAGNLIVSNSTGDSILIAIAINGLIDPVNSKVYTVAGTSAASTGGTTDGNGGLATAATFSTPRGLALDAAENVFIGDYNDEQVRKVTSPGMNGQVTVANLNAALVTDVVGNGTAATTGNGGLGTVAETASPQGLGFDQAGLLYIEQYSSGNDFIRTVNTITDIVNAYAGTGAATFTGDGGPAALATFYTPTALKWNLGNRLTVFDQSNNRLRNIYPTPFFSALGVGATSTQNAAFQAASAVTPSSIVTSNGEFTAGALAGTGCTLNSSVAANTYCTLPINFVPAGPGLRTGQLRVTDSNGNVYNDTLLGVGLSPAAAFYGAVITTVAGNGNAGSTGNGAAATAATVNTPRGGAFDSFGNFYFADSGNNVIREIAKSTGNISIVAGNGVAGFSGDNAAASAAELNAPTGVVVDPAGNLYIADARNNRIREVSNGIITTIAGTGVAGYAGDTGLATLASFNNPSAIAIDNTGTLYIADTGNNALRAFNPNGGVIVTLAGTGTAGDTGDTGVPQLATLNAPTGVFVDLSGNIYIADTGNAVIRQIVPITFGIINFQGTINTIAGTPGGSANTGDGGAATAAGLLNPSGIGVDASGNVYIAAGGQIRIVNPAGIITTIAGTGGAGPYSGEGGSATAAVIPAPAQNLAVDEVGNLYLSDTSGNRILSIAGSNAATLNFGSQTIATSSSPQTVTLYNSGNQALTLSNIVVPTSYTLSNSGANPCTKTTVIAAGGACTFTVTFTPPSVANYASQITITDNALDNAASTQTIPLSGIGVGHLNPTSTTVTFSPASPTYGQTVTVTATVTGSPTPTGTVNFVINSKTTVPEPLVNGVATYQLVGLPAGNDNITANYLGDSVNAGSTGSTSFSVQPAVLTVTANNLSKYPTQANPTLTYTITGFVNGDTAAKVVTGAPAISTTATASSPAGSYPITVTQGTLAATNYTFAFVPGTLTVLSSTFTITIFPTSLSIAAGQNAAVTVTVTPTPGYTGTVALSCSALPANALCTFNNASVAVDPSGPVVTQLTISTNNYSEIATLNSGRQGGGNGKAYWALGLPFLSLYLLFIGKRRRTLLRDVVAILLFATVIQALSGCTTASQNSPAFTGNIVIAGTDKTANTTAQATLVLAIH
jgi:sugar lactone lactonase YvrE